ncbi:MAG TPA: BTAD domain-containing putative transcriptional regulator [Gaiellaceae bacterium]|nr:BTAD domain-containing putative transcriptional regulator [Gaiellaceae bacterium]
MPLVEVRLLGPLEACVEGRRLGLRRQKQRALLAVLALRAGEVVSIDRLIDALWGDAPPKAAVGSLQNLVSELRKLLGADVLRTRAPGYLLDIDRDAVDVHRFERLTREARDLPPAERAAQLRGALDLWHGAALADVRLDESWAAEAVRLDELRVAATEELLEAELELGRHSAAIGELESLVGEHPLRERPVGLLMLALYRAGRQADALEAYRAARLRLVEGLGIDPSAELQRLEQAILRHDPDLEPAPAPKQAPPTDRRKTVTILFADVVESTELAALLDPEVLRGFLHRYLELVRVTVDRHGGVVEKLFGDAAMAAFGIPTQHEDDALRAVRAANELREAIAGLSGELEEEHGVGFRLRIGLDTGEALVADPGTGESFATGAVVNVAARLEQASPPGEILLGESTYRLVRHTVDAEPIDPVGVGGGLQYVPAFRFLGVADVARPLGTGPFVGRADELAWLQAAFAGAVAERRSRVVFILGDAGVGKTRLVSELVASLGGSARALVGRCVSYGQGATYLPLVEVIRQAAPEPQRESVAQLLAGDEQAHLVAERVAQLSGDGGGAPSTGEVFWAVGRFLIALAANRPLLVVLEDVHWAEPGLLDFVDYLDSWTAPAPLMLACLARRELLDERPGWKGRDRVLALDPLGDAEAVTLVAELAGDTVDEAARERIVGIADGNALFLEQLLAFAEEAGADALGAVPPSVEALLAGRLDRLQREERALLDRAAVVGREFSRGALLHLSPPDEIAPLDGRLASLVRRGFVRPDRADDDSYRFHHVLLRDVAYAGVTKEARAGLHERFGTWLEKRGEGVDEIVGYHLEQAHRYSKELRPGDEGVAELARRAGRVLTAAGLQAWKRADARATVNLLGRAAALLPTGEPGRGEILCELGIALGHGGDVAAGEAALIEAIEEADALQDEAVLRRARIELGQMRMHRGGDPDELVGLVHESTPVFEAAGDVRALGRAWRALGYARGSMQGRCVEWLEGAERALAYYRRSSWSPAGCLSEIAAALYYGPTAVAEGLERCERLLGETNDRLGTANVLVYLAGLHSLADRFDEALALIDEADGVYREIGDEHGIAESRCRIRGRIYALADDPETAETAFQGCRETFEQREDAAALSSLAADVGQALYAQGRFDEAGEYASLAESAAPAGDIVAQFSWRSLKGKLLARKRRTAEAEAVALEALTLADETDTLVSRGEVLLDLATVVCTAGRVEEAAVRAEQALGLFELKGSTAYARRARAQLADLEVVP